LSPDLCKRAGPSFAFSAWPPGRASKISARAQVCLSPLDLDHLTKWCPVADFSVLLVLQCRPCWARRWTVDDSRRTRQSAWRWIPKPVSSYRISGRVARLMLCRKTCTAVVCSLSVDARLFGQGKKHLLEEICRDGLGMVFFVRL
jgi:hypothetical protein